MNYAVSLLLGLVVGVALFGLTLMLYNPFIADRGISPLSVSSSELVALNYSAMYRPTQSLLHKRWRLVTKTVSRKSPAVMGGTNSQDQRDGDRNAGWAQSDGGHRHKILVFFRTNELLKGDALVDSVWYVYLPERGSLFMQQSENYWPFLRDVGWPAFRSGENWKGSWIGDLTAGPGVLGTAL